MVKPEVNVTDRMIEYCHSAASELSNLHYGRVGREGLMLCCPPFTEWYPWLQIQPEWRTQNEKPKKVASNHDKGRREVGSN